MEVGPIQNISETTFKSESIIIKLLIKLNLPIKILIPC